MDNLIKKIKKDLTLTLGHNIALQMLFNNKGMRRLFGVKELANLASVSVRTLHVYDRIGLLTPSLRTDAGYRKYGEQELFRLQQILFYKELDFSLTEISDILDDPDFNLVNGLEGHKIAIKDKIKRLDILLNTINKTINHLKFENMENFEELYEGLSKEQAIQYRNEAIEKWGEEAVARAEKALQEMPKMSLEQLKADQKDIALKLKKLAKENPESEAVQEQIARHYANIRSFWGVSDPTDLKAEQYKGLAELYVADNRYTASDGKPDPEFAKFMREAMVCFANLKLE